jgi:RNA polymerase sigma-70 factor (ECF subfamily)
VILMAFGSFWWVKQGRDQALPTATQPRLLAAAAARLPGSAGDGGAGMSSADAKRPPLRRRATDDNQPADAALVDQLRTGDANAFAGIVRAWSPMMLHVARMYVSTDASAQEVVQEAWLAMIQGLDKFEGRSSLRTWMLAILGNIGRSRGVREARTVPLSSLGDEDDGPAVDPDRFRGPDDRWPRNWTPLGKPRPWPRSPEEEIMAAENRTQLQNGLAELPERQRTVVTLRDVHGLSSDEVSSLLGLSAGNQRVLLHRGRSRLRGLLEMHYAAGEPVMGT